MFHVPDELGDVAGTVGPCRSIGTESNATWGVPCASLVPASGLSTCERLF